MTGKEAEEIYWAAYREAAGRSIGANGVDQGEVVRVAWDAVVAEFNAESDREWAARYLAMADEGQMSRN